MNIDMFNELLASVEEMDEIVRGQRAPNAISEFPEPEVKEIRKKIGLS